MSESDDMLHDNPDFPGPIPHPGMERFPGPPPMRPGMMPPMRPPHDGPMGGPPMRPPGRFPPPFGQGFPNQNFRMRPPFGPPGNISTPPTNTTLPKPPIFDKDGQAWLEACTAEGKVYYFNAKTRETKWERPDSGDASKEEENKETKESEDSEAQEKKEDTPAEEGDSSTQDKTDSSKRQQSMQNPPPQGMPPPFGMPPMMRPPPGMPPPGFPPAFAGQGMGPPRFPPFPGFPMPPPDFMPKTVGDWTEHRLPDGRLYYHHNKTKESKWEKPKEFDSQQANEKEGKKSEQKDESGEKENKQEETTKSEEPENENKQKKPVGYRAIVGTGWHLVWTGDGRVFFFSPSTKLSIWERPKELQDNLTIDELLRMGPPSKEEKDGIAAQDTNANAKPAVTKEEPMETASSQPKVEIIEGPMPKKKKRNHNNDEFRSLPIMQEQQERSKQGKDEDRTMKEAEVKKSIIPLDERMKMFTQLLREKQVSAFSTWEKELHKILFDPRYLLLTMKERKNCYEKYVRIRAVEERKERVQKLKEKKDEFKQLLDEVVASTRLSFSDFAAKNSKDSRYKGIDKMRERETLFNEFMADFKKHEKERLRAREEKLRKNFFELLSELNNLDGESQWKKVKGSVETDKRYELVGSSTKREQFFNEYIKELSEKKETEEPKEKTEEEENTETKEEEEKPPSPLNEEEEEERKLDEKYERMEASLRKREEEVRAQKEVYEKDREKERGIHMHDKAVQHFKALLADMVRDTHYSWKETRRTLRKDPRWSALDVLDKTTKESLFDEHIQEINEKRKKSFRRLLEEADVPLDGYWREVRREIKDDPRYAKYGNSELREEEFEQFIREKTTLARNEFRELLRETKIITYKSRKVMSDNPGHWKDIKEVLKKDKRYHIMSTLADERDRLIHTYIDDLHKRGPPPPPTATNPASRYKKD